MRSVSKPLGLTTIEANGFQLFWLDGNAENPANHTGLLPFENAVLSLKYFDGTIIDAVDWNISLAENTSRGRVSDGSPNWTDFATPTPRVTNSLQIILPENVVINEAQSDNFITHADTEGEFDDWIELYNPTDLPFDLAGYYVFRSLGSASENGKIPTTAGDSTVIQPGDFLMLYADEKRLPGVESHEFQIEFNR